MKTLLHVGCGQKNTLSLIGFSEKNWNQLRIDIGENAKPDVMGTLTDMSAAQSKSVDAIYSSHNIEHIFPHEVNIVFKEFLLVL